MPERDDYDDAYVKALDDVVDAARAFVHGKYICDCNLCAPIMRLRRALAYVDQTDWNGE